MRYQPPSRHLLPVALCALGCAALIAACPAGAADDPVPLAPHAGSPPTLVDGEPWDVDVMLRAAQEKYDTERFMARTPPGPTLNAAGQPLLPGYGYVTPINRCSCLRRNSAASSAGGPLDCWRMDLGADPFPTRPGVPANADYAAAVRRYHLHAKAIDYYQPGQIPPGEEISVKGYIAQNCDAENWLGRCEREMRERCLANAFGTAATHDCAMNPNDGRILKELTDWLVINLQPSTCPSPFTAWWPWAGFNNGFENGLTGWSH